MSGRKISGKLEGSNTDGIALMTGSPNDLINSD
jgi:hypothetical protein